MEASLGARMGARDASRFVGRASELARVERLLGAADPPSSVVLIHGPGGIGKSTLLRELARRGEAHGRAVVRVDGRDLGPLPEALDEAIAPAFATPDPLVLIDTYEAMLALGRYLRAAVLPALPPQAVVVIAGRRSPEAAWRQGGWEHVCEDFELGPLPGEDARALLERHGISEPARIAAVTAWSGGSPLALALAGDLDAPVAAPAPSSDGKLIDGLVRALVDLEPDPGQRAVLGVAAIARVTTLELLRSVLPDRDAERDLAWLADRTFADPKGTGIRLHELTGKAVHGSLRHDDPTTERALRRRIAEHLYARAVAGEIELTIDLAHLVEDPVIRWGYGWDGSERLRVDDVRPGDAAIVAEALGDGHGGRWWLSTERWFADAPDRIFVVRDAEERLCGYATAITTRNAPRFAWDDAAVGPWLRHAEAAGGNAVLWRDSIDFTKDAVGLVQAMLGLAGVLRCGLRNPRYAYLPIDARMPEAVAFANVLGATHLTELDPSDAADSIQCWRADYGPGGLLGAQLDVVYREIGTSPPAAGPEPVAVSFTDVREALRTLHVPHRLALSPLAADRPAAERASWLAARLQQAAGEAFGSTEPERALHAVLVRGYLEPAASHELAADELHLSRSAYFRRLRAATERLTEHLARERAAA